MSEWKQEKKKKNRKKITWPSPERIRKSSKAHEKILCFTTDIVTMINYSWWTRLSLLIFSDAYFRVCVYEWWRFVAAWCLMLPATTIPFFISLMKCSSSTEYFMLLVYRCLRCDIMCNRFEAILGSSTWHANIFRRLTSLHHHRSIAIFTLSFDALLRDCNFSFSHPFFSSTSSYRSRVEHPIAGACNCLS